MCAKETSVMFYPNVDPKLCIDIATEEIKDKRLLVEITVKNSTNEENPPPPPNMVGKWFYLFGNTWLVRVDNIRDFIVLRNDTRVKYITSDM